MSDPTEHDAQSQGREPPLGPESEVHRLDAGGSPALLGASLAELRREHPGLLRSIAAAVALAGVALAVLVALAGPTGRR